MAHFRNILILFFYLCGISAALAQQPQFTEEMLSQPKANSAKLEKSFKIISTKKVVPKVLKNTLALENGYAKHELKNPESWYKLKDEVRVKEVHIVFSRYPKDFQFWRTNFHELLANRLKALFDVDHELNDNSIKWMLVVQTDCETEEQAKAMFHGVLITYDKLTKKEIAEREKEREKKLMETGKPDYSSARRRVDRYMTNAGGMLDSSVYKALDRNKNWKNSLCVIDWTSSMYQYSAQCLAWHFDYIDSSGMKFFAFFNDGDAKIENDKRIGETGGIYFASSENMNKVVRVFNTAMRKGLGGEIPENDIEAILGSMEKYPNFGEIILIADNSPMRDFDLWDQVKHPVRVILADGDWTVNPEYINLAYLTGGSFHTGDVDIYFDRGNAADSVIKVSKMKFVLDTELNLYVCKDKQQCRYMAQEVAAREKKNLEELKSKPIYRSMHKDKIRKRPFRNLWNKVFGKV